VQRNAGFVQATVGAAKNACNCAQIADYPRAFSFQDRSEGTKVGSRRKQRRVQEAAIAAVPPKRYGWLYPFALGAILAGFLVALASRPTATNADLPITPIANRLPSLGELTCMPGKQLERQDIALLNLRCAEGLPGSEDLNVDQCLATLDRWASRVRHETDRHLYKYRQNPKEFNNSEGFFRMLTLITVLQQDFKVHYNPDRIRDVDFRRSQDLFIHGMVGSDNGGTCVSMPVLYTAIGRRLGYPVYLVTAKEHVFCRWEKGKERFNVEATAQGMSNFDDTYYMKWPKPISDEELKSGEYLKSLSVAESLATFLAARGHCLEDNGSVAAARVSYAQAAALSPRPIYQGFLVQSMGFVRSPVFQQPRRPPNPAMVYSPYGQVDHYTPNPGYSPYQAAKPIMPNMVGFPQTNPNGSPDFGVWP
jgi:hypothetical protein